MNVKLLSILVILVMAGLLLPRVSTFATWSDSETSMGNTITTGSVDLKVNGQDDRPWGSAVGIIFDIPDGHTCTSYERDVSLFNAGDEDAVAYLEIKNLEDTQNLSAVLHTEIWYDGSLVKSDWMSKLVEQEIELGNLLNSEIKTVRMVLHPAGGDTGDSLKFDIQFDLFGSWADSEVSQSNYFVHGSGESATTQSGTIDFWLDWESNSDYTQTQIENWLCTICTSVWLDSNTIEEMKALLEEGKPESEAHMRQKFLAHYLAQWLNQISGRQDPDTLHNVTGYDLINYLNLTNPEATSGAEIISAIEAKCGASPTDAEFEIMKNVCMALNQLDI